MKSKFGNKALAKLTIYSWFKEFYSDRKNLRDDVWEEPRSTVAPLHIDVARKLIASDRHVTHDSIEKHLKISRTRIH